MNNTVLFTFPPTLRVLCTGCACIHNKFHHSICTMCIMYRIYMHTQ